MSFMLTVSFLIHTILIIVIYYLFKELQNVKANQPKNITPIFEKYLQEIRNENERLKTTISATSTKTIEQTNLESTDTLDNLEAFPDPYMENKVETEDTTETSLQAQILQLDYQGMTPESIAKQLNCGYAEVVLSLKLHSE